MPLASGCQTGFGTRLLALLALVTGSLWWTSSTALADDLWQLPIGTNPQTLRMRASAWQMAAEDDTTSPDEPGGIFTLPSGKGLGVESGGVDRLERRQLEADVEAPPKPLSDKLIFQFNLGTGLDSGLPSEDPMLSGARLGEGTRYKRTRLYSFADTVVGTKGLGISSLNTYLAAHFRYNRERADSNTSTALPSVYDREVDRPLVRSAYGEADGLFEHPLLKPLYMRAGRSYHYDLVPMQYDGLKVGYDTPALKLSLLAGTRPNLYGVSSEIIAPNNTVLATSIRVDFYEWKGWPLVAFASSLSFDEQQHSRGGVALRWNRDILVSSSWRSSNGKLARSDLSLRARVSKVTTVNVMLNNRFRSDWSFGLLQIKPIDGYEESSPYLDLGQVLPRSVLSVRYGTVLLRNLDLLLRGGAALDRRDRATTEATSFSSSYAELGGAAEVRVRRSLRVGAALSSRRYFIGNKKAEFLVPGEADELPGDLASTGTTSFWEAGLNMHYSPGARQFSANSEFYGRRYSLRSEFLGDTVTDLRTGGRFSIEGWVKDRVRLKAEYDLTIGRLVMAPELRDLRTLRVLMEGSF